jgi:hypothetical protein
MKFKKNNIKKFLRAFLFSFSLLICLNLLFMFVMYLETQNLKEGVPRPNFKTLLRVFERKQLYYADVQNHILLIEKGYEKIDTKAGDFDWGKRHINWAYHPLSPALGSLLNVIVGSPFWSLWILNQIALMTILIGFSYWSRANLLEKEKNLTAWLLLLFFIIPPLVYFVNFVILPGLLIGTVFFSFRSWLRNPQEKRAAFRVLVISSFLLGFTRFQGLLVNASCILLLIILVAWHRKFMGWGRVGILFLANISPLLITMGIFRYYANDPFAWAKIQESWGVSLVLPWQPIIRYWKSGIIFNFQGDDLFFSYFRVFVLIIFTYFATKVILTKKNFIKNFIARCYRDSFINLYFVAISFGLVVLIYFTDLMVGNHRLASLAYLSVLIWLEQSRSRMSRFALLFLLFIRIAEFTLFFMGVKAFIW